MKRLLFCVVMIFSFALAGFGSVMPSASANDAVFQNSMLNAHHHHHHRRHHHHPAR